MPVVELFSRVADELALSIWLRNLILYWNILTRKLWEEFFRVLGISFPFGEPAKDALTLTLICFIVSARLALKKKSTSIIREINGMKEGNNARSVASVIVSLVSLIILLSYYTASTIAGVPQKNSLLDFLETLLYLQLVILLLIIVYIIISTPWNNVFDGNIHVFMSRLLIAALASFVLLFIAIYGLYESSYFLPDREGPASILSFIYFYGTVFLFSVIPTLSITTLIIVDFKSPVVILVFLIFLVALDFMLYVTEIALHYLNEIISKAQV